MIRAQEARRGEIDQLHERRTPFAALQAHVSRAQIAMDDPGIVHGARAREDLPEDLEDLGLRHRPVALHDLRQRLSDDRLEDEERVAVVAPDVEHPHHVRMIDVREEGGLARDHPRGLVGEVMRHLEDDDPRCLAEALLAHEELVAAPLVEQAIDEVLSTERGVDEAVVLAALLELHRAIRIAQGRWAQIV